MGRRVVLFPVPLQGHINPMLQLGNILYSKGFSITVIHTKFNSPNQSKYPHFTFQPIPDGLSENQAVVLSLLTVLNINCVAPFRDCMTRLLEEPIACLITDAIWHFTQAVADSLGLPRIVLRTSSLSSFLAFAAFPLLRKNGYLPKQVITDALWHFTQAVADSLGLPRIVLRTSSLSSFLAFATFPLLRKNGYLPKQDSQLAAPVLELPPLRVRDIPTFGTDLTEDLYQLIECMIKEIKASSGLIWNSFEELEQPALATLGQDFPIPVFPVGPFHKYFPASSSSLLAQDQSSISWLDKQAPKSVIYVSFGSIAAMDETEFLEMAWGLANSLQPFLWVVRPGLIRGSEWIEPLPDGFMEAVSGRGHIVKWAPQQEVLAHSATGGFWTHNGWNSTLESICEGVPMICSPCFGDQMVNARYVSHVWRVGVQLENGLEREEVEKGIKRLMVEREGEEMRENNVFEGEGKSVSRARWLFIPIFRELD